MDLVSLTMVAILFAFGVVGLCMARKIRNGDSFYIMEEKAPTLFLVCGICMSYISAVTMSSGPGVCYENGPFLLLTTAQPGAWFGMLVALLFIGRKMKAIGCYTMPDYFAKRFSDNNVTCLALIIMMAVMEIYGIGQLVSIGTVLSEATGFSYGEIILIFTLAIIMFCVPGGTWGIMMTDTLMFVVVLLTAFIVCPVVIAALYPEAIQTLPASFWSVQGIHEAGLGYRISQTVLWFTFFAGSPVIITRVFPAKNDFAVFKATVISVVLIALISFLLYFTAGLMRGVEPGIVPQEQVILRAFRGHAPLIIGLIGVGGDPDGVHLHGLRPVLPGGLLRLPRLARPAQPGPRGGCERAQARPHRPGLRDWHRRRGRLPTARRQLRPVHLRLRHLRGELAPLDPDGSALAAL